ncbi:hypothetical protein KAK06_08405 [Ideonella sp. 4Y11]|uniref:Entry exclusion lipoprotein TrbK n=1 Tax=Ideonella aquatica TaxID=2824119 RepID=A0A941BKU4_9BURK|nr:hypothetical protein [Ideonella aquatica]MBQ0958979.1 hypothetical protein [Ideonella aquatica]
MATLSVLAPVRTALVFSGLLLGMSACQSGAALPDDVRDFVARRDQCDHFRGEETDNEKRQAFLDEQLKKYCTGTDAQLAQLKKKYAGQSAATKALSRFDPRIE